ncbi:MAG: OsmC family protein [Candidatus Tectomicrobia bacterium]|uniref:OsmC family protein n=1 Tax=Tectimicrobiota bacterium TaxID=2528274 RepID=A0A932I0Z3_UNCTE|nr:OsmC family protein [Candidatus Tectomicrobia bacterium]
MSIRPKELPEKTDNWAEADFKGHAKSVVTVKSGHTLVVDEPKRLGGTDEGPSPTGYLAVSLAGCTAVILERCAKDAKLEVESLRVKSTIVYSPRGIAGEEGYPAQPTEAASEVWLRIQATPAQVEALKKDYFRRCPVYNLFKASGCKMTDIWRVNE